MPTLLVDLDEVLFPFAQTYAAYRERVGLTPIPEQAWAAYHINNITLPGHQDLMEPFFADPTTLATPPIEEAVEVILPIAGYCTIIGCTSRYEKTEGESTLIWVERHLPWLVGVHFAGWHPEAGRRSPKASIAKEYEAVALIDDTKLHLEGLPRETVGLLVQRPAGVASEIGAKPWSTVQEELTALLNG